MNKVILHFRKIMAASLIFSLSILLIGMMEFYNHLLVKFLESRIFSHNLLVSFFPILAMFLLKSFPYLAFLGVIALVSALVSKFLQNKRKNQPVDYFSIALDLLVPFLLIYFILFEYQTTPFALTYYYYYQSAAFSQLLKNELSYDTLILFSKLLLAAVIFVIFAAFRLSKYLRKYILSCGFLAAAASMPMITFLFHHVRQPFLPAALIAGVFIVFVIVLTAHLRSRKSRTIGIIATLLLLLGVWSNLYFYRLTANHRLNVVHIILDTLRFQSFNERTMPFLYSLKNKGVYFPNSYSSSDNTVTSHNAIYYGKYPSLIGLEKGPFPATTIMEALRSNNYHTAVVSANGRFCIVNGYGKGVEDFYEAWKTDNHIRNVQIMPEQRLSGKFDVVKKYLSAYEKRILGKSNHIEKRGLRSDAYRFYNYEPARVVNEFVKTVLQTHPKSQPLYLFVNYLDPHTPYLAPEPHRIARVVDELKLSLPQIYQKLDFAQVSATDTTIFKRIMLMWNEVDSVKDQAAKDRFLTFCYEENINYLDEQLKELFDHFDRIHLFKNTLVIVTSDHGESLGEHGLYGHGNKRLYNPEIRVPLFFLFPNALKNLTEGKIINVNTQSIDFFPTLLDFLQINTDFRLNGKSLLPFIFSPHDSTDFGYSIAEYTGVTAITNNRFKLIRTDRTTELYDLQNDPDEKNNLAGALPAVVAELNHVLDEMRNTAQPVVPSSVFDKVPQQEYDPETIKLLKTLGYIK